MLETTIKTTLVQCGCRHLNNLNISTCKYCRNYY